MEHEITTDENRIEVDSISSSVNEKQVGSDYDFSAERTTKRRLLIQRTESGSTSAKNPVYVEWYGLNYSIPKENTNTWKCKKSSLESGKTRLSIIENIHGCANPGEILAIMGPSGCGKTTLLNILGDRVGNKGVKGTITMNGFKPTKCSKRYVAYCTQDDIFFPEITVKDTLGFTARLRLPRDVPLDDKLKQVDATMQLLNLTKSARTKIGDNRVRGVSGGERKRVSIASELLTDPSVILLDEPTSGLDSALALELAKILKELAIKQRKTIIIVIHQPSSQVFEIFDKLMLMCDGHMVYFGKRANVADYLANLGFKCHPNYNLADYILELLNDDASKQKLIHSYANQVRDDPTGKKEIEKYSRRKHDNNNDIKQAPVLCDYGWEATFFQQVSILTERTFKQSLKDILSTTELIHTFAMVVICCLIWYRVPFTEENIHDRTGSIFFVVVFWSFEPFLGAVATLPMDLVMLTKERQSRSYRLSAYFLSKQIAELPLILIKPALFTIVVYWVTGLLPDFGRFMAYLVVILLNTLTSQGFGYFFGASLLNVQKSVSVGTVFMLGSMLLGGFYVKNLPPGLAWLKYLSFVTYSYGLNLQIQFDTSKAQFRCGSPESLGMGQTSICDLLGYNNSIPGTIILENERPTELPWYINFIVLLAVCIAVRFVAYYCLFKNTKK
ncbi:unnamed protein product [Rhizophagus irregularis]|uniref:ABC transporter domain-containing protein n=1 Tax=Rhizophagus irregularis TaxID=588596 RepID=A0A915YRR9_9GLOM|nr:unnamed protein product [Rhizophagus irregularis]